MHIKYIMLALVDIVAVIELIAPKSIWKLTRWQYKASTLVEPSEGVLIFIRIVAVFVLVVGNAALLARS